MLTRAYASNNSPTDIVVLRPAGRGFENRRETKSPRSWDISNTALYMRCWSRLPRRMSTMKATAGRTAAMYVKFCSGPTPMHAAWDARPAEVPGARIDTCARCRRGSPTGTILPARISRWRASERASDSDAGRFGNGWLDGCAVVRTAATIRTRPALPARHIVKRLPPSRKDVVVVDDETRLMRLHHVLGNPAASRPVSWTTY